METFEWDIFIAFHNSFRSSGSYGKACEIKRFLEGHGVKCFLCEKDQNVDFGDTPSEAADSVLFLLVANETIEVNARGKLESFDLLNECKSFYNNRICRERNNALARVYCYGELDARAADRFHPMFSGKDHLCEKVDGQERTLERLLHWICVRLPDKVSADQANPYVPVAEKPAEPPESKQKEEPAVDKFMSFDYDAERGIMLNPEDRTRNISFRSDTLNTFMGDIYQAVSALTDSDTAYEIFYNAGYKSGKNFAERVAEQWGGGFDINSIIRKANTWCSFDSKVGWGKFKIDIQFDEQKEHFTGTLEIDNAIMINMRKRLRTCGFIRGYCTGVLEVLSDDMSVELTCRDCPLRSPGRVGTVCRFDILMRED